MRRVCINVHEPKNVSMINNVLVKREIKRGKSDIDEHNNSWAVVYHIRFSGKCEPVGVINDLHQWITFTSGRAWNRS